MPAIVTSPVRWALLAAGLYLFARLTLPTAFWQYVGVIEAEQTFMGPVLRILAGVVVFEVCVVISAVLDYREAKLNIVGAGQAWAAAHFTVFVRGFRRVRWVAAGLLRGGRHLVAELREGVSSPGTEREYVQLDPTAPFDGRIIDPDRDEDVA